MPAGMQTNPYKQALSSFGPRQDQFQSDLSTWQEQQGAFQSALSNYNQQPGGSPAIPGAYNEGDASAYNFLSPYNSVLSPSQEQGSTETGSGPEFYRIGGGAEGTYQDFTASPGTYSGLYGGGTGSEGTATPSPWSALPGTQSESTFSGSPISPWYQQGSGTPAVEDTRGPVPTGPGAAPTAPTAPQSTHSFTNFFAAHPSQQRFATRGGYRQGTGNPYGQMYEGLAGGHSPAGGTQ